MNRRFIILLLSLFGFHYTFSQEYKTGIVKLIRYTDGDDMITQSVHNSTFALYSKKSKKVLITNQKDSLLVTTDSVGYFKIPKTYFKSCKFIIQKNFAFPHKEFIYQDGLGNRDSIVLTITDYRLSNKIDSIKAPDFYAKYSPLKAETDFNTGNKRILLGPAWYSDKALLRLEKQSKKYGFTIEYPEMYGTLPELRILNKYNKRMMELLGINQ